MLSPNALKAARVVDPHSYKIPDVFTRNLHQSIGSGCYRTRPSDSPKSPIMSNYDVVGVADQVLAHYVKP